MCHVLEELCFIPLIVVISCHNMGCQRVGELLTLFIAVGMLFAFPVVLTESFMLKVLVF